MFQKTWHPYHKQTGVFTGNSFTATTRSEDDQQVPPGMEPNIPDGHDVIAAHGHIYHPHKHRVDVGTGLVVDYSPPRPSAEELALAASAEKRGATLLAIAQLETIQHRAVRESILTGDKSRLQAIEDQIASLRKNLT